MVFQDLPAQGEPQVVRAPAEYQPKRVYIRPEDLENGGIRQIADAALPCVKVELPRACRTMRSAENALKRLCARPAIRAWRKRTRVPTRR